MIRTGPQSWPRLALAVATISMALSGGALAQTASDDRVQSAYAQWRQLSQTEVNCVDRALRGQNSNLWTWIQRGIKPSDAAVAKHRAGCSTQTATPNAQALSAFAQNTADKKAAADKAAAEKAASEKAIAEKAAAAKAATEKAATEKAAAAKIAAEKAAAEKAAEEKLAAEKAAAEKAASEKAAAEKAAAVAAEKAAEKAAAEKAAAAEAEKVAAEKAAAEKAAAEKAAAEEHAAAEKAAADKLAAEKAAAEAVAAEKIAADKAALDAAIADAERVKAEAAQSKAATEQQQQDAINAAFAYAAAESRISFVYGLILGLVFASLAAAVALFMHRKKTAAARAFEPAIPHDVIRGRQSEFDRLVRAIDTEQERRFAKPPASGRVDWSALH